MFRFEALCVVRSDKTPTRLTFPSEGVVGPNDVTVRVRDQHNTNFWSFVLTHPWHLKPAAWM